MCTIKDSCVIIPRERVASGYCCSDLVWLRVMRGLPPFSLDLYSYSNFSESPLLWAYKLPCSITAWDITNVFTLMDVLRSQNIGPVSRMSDSDITIT